MARKLVGVTGTARRWSSSWWCIRLALTLVGCKAHRISVLNPDIPRELDAIIISGGDDIHPSLYEGEIHSDETDPERDQLEIQCITTAINRDIPILGICRGAQLINVVSGGSLYGDIRHLRSVTSNRAHLFPHKHISIDRPSVLFTILGRDSIRVNSLHHQAIKDLGDSLRAIAKDRDDIIQAIEDSTGKQVLGVQWHPEYLLFLPKQLAIFKWLKC
ncbi:MAG: gamma-glutamyl-gamma-aminobutyrate hydrolase family protein [Pseudomonadales bacterium]